MYANGGKSVGVAIRYANDDQASASVGDNEPNLTRITADLAERVGKWSGVDACCDNAIAMAQFKPHFDAWLAETVAAHPGRELVASGWSNGEVKCESARHPFGRKKCKGWFTKIACYADFAPQD